MNETHPLALIRRFFAVIAQPRTYGSIAYIWLGFPLGVLYFVTLVTGSALSIGLSLLWIGLLLMAAMVLCVWSLALFERAQSKWLLGESFPMLLREKGSQTSWQWFRSLVKDPATWKGAVFLFLKFPFGLASWVISVITFSLSAAFIAAPLDRHSDIHFELWILEDPTGGWLFAAFGVLLLFTTLHLHNLMGKAWAVMSRYLLAVSSQDRPSEPPALPLEQELVPA
jgi:hypothetical protein